MNMDSFLLENNHPESFVLNPLIGRYKFDVSVTHEEEDFMPQLNQSFTKQLMKRGRIFSSTPLRNINYSPSSLKKFGALLSEDINRSESENLNSYHYHVDIKPVNSNVQHPCPLKVVVQRTNCKNQENTSIVFVGIFCTWRMSNIVPCREYLNLPFLFTTGSQKFTSLMTDLFQNYFGCSVSQILFPQPEIRWLLAIIVQQISVEAAFGKSIQLVYQMNSSDLKMDFTISFSHMKEIWNDIHDETRSEIKFEEIETLYHAFNEHVQESLGFDLNHFFLKRFSVPDLITIETDGKINVFNTEMVDLVFRFLKDRVLINDSTM